ncbi:hypothetical protein O6H91_20G055400 [Diphasiastrum complanatum]|uniref:Uncharacterized protein n=1 Tax=Diphasiastrum complanatum TaxID=34168 RepID=A0ACC2AQP9_DIPCM|nr:hypothetical protein O6H91_20G055400 [Diphasiastrum complanatum]
MEPSGGKTSWSSLAAAALVGASVVAISAYWLHRRAVEQLFERAMDAQSLDGGSPHHKKQHPSVKARQRRRSVSSNGTVRSSCCSLADAPSCGNEFEIIRSSQTYDLERDVKIDKSQSMTAFAALSSIPQGLPTLKTCREGSSQSVLYAVTTKRATPMGNSLIRPSTPKSPIGSVGAFESLEVSEEEDEVLNTEGNINDNDEYADADEGGSSRARHAKEANISTSAYPGTTDRENGHVDQNQKGGSIMIKSHSIPGELHGIHTPDPVAADILRKEPEQETFVRLQVTPIEAPSEEEEEVCILMQECLALREKYVYRERVHPWDKEEIIDPSTPKPNPDPFQYEPEVASKHVCRMEDGVIHVYPDGEAKEELFPVADATMFFTDMHRILRIISLGNVRTLTHHRLRLLEQKFSLHLMLNADREFLAQKSAPHRDFYNVRKVDTHVHHSSCMNQKHLLRFIKSKLRKEPDELVIFRDGKYLTLREVFESLDLTGYDLNVDLLDVHADKNTFHRFDKFNLKYNPCGQSRLREIFLKQDNLIQGRFLAELTKEVFSDLAASKYQMAEYRISVYGRKQSEWDQLSSWIVNNELYSENVVWLIQLPRLYNVYKDMGIVTSFQTMLENVFIPLFEVTVDPGSHPQLHVFLKQVVGFDMVDDESKPERRPTKHMQTPAQWQISFNPAYSYWAYYVYANLYTLNKLRESKGMNTIKFRPHSAHGNNLRKSPSLQYLYYLAQIGLSMSPLSNNSLFLDYHRNPFPMFFARGLNVSLSTDDPLQIHLTKEPLVEEYSIAAQVWKLSSCDLCEIARNSVYQSGFSHSLKSHWVGSKYYKRGPLGNDIHKTNVPHMRVEFRHEVWREELDYVYLGASKISEEIDF